MTAYIKTDEVLRICKCPRCLDLHKKKIFYTGRAEYPPVICRLCAADDISGEESYVNLKAFDCGD
jgi:hypothetical protein